MQVLEMPQGEHDPYSENFAFENSRESLLSISVGSGCFDNTPPRPMFFPNRASPRPIRNGRRQVSVPMFGYNPVSPLNQLGSARPVQRRFSDPIIFVPQIAEQSPRREDAFENILAELRRINRIEGSSQIETRVRAVACTLVAVLTIIVMYLLIIVSQYGK